MQKWDANQEVAAWVNGALVDLNTPLEQDAELFPVLADSPAGREILRHSTAHAMAQAVLRLFPGAKLAIGPAIENGFYYDFDLPVPLAPEDLPKITAEMENIRRENLPIERQEVPRSQAREMFVQKDQPYKVELVDDIPEDTVSLYRQGEFMDLCRGPHLPSTGRLPAFKLESIAGAYWRGDSKRPMLQRIYGWAFPTEQELQEFVHRREEAAARDHRRLGQVLDLFSLHEEGPGFPFWHPKGMVLRNVLEDFWRREHHKAGYQEIRTPIILNEALWHQSGHWDHYRENMYFTRIDDQGYAIKPMNCPGGILVFKRKIHSYRDLPERLAELGLVHRHELSGVLHGLMRVRSFTQDDAHIFCTPEQMKAEIRAVIALADKFYRIFGFPYRLELSTRPENSMGTEEQWERATNALREALEELHQDYQINEGDGAFYGPKIDFHLRDSLGRTWQCGTIQLDFQMPELFDLAYVGEDGQKHRPVMLHRTIFGSIERFIGILIEHFAGAFPTWIAPVQALVLPVTGELEGYARQVARTLEDAGFRAEVDARDEKIGYRIREAQVQQVPYMLVVGVRTRLLLSPATSM
ncbi:MAG: threonine--tRNA ligase [Firmicutes bacterium]|nr:threonine--tRNA ligase [Bacillota bacterium]